MKAFTIILAILLLSISAYALNLASSPTLVVKEPIFVNNTEPVLITKSVKLVTEPTVDEEEPDIVVDDEVPNTIEMDKVTFTKPETSDPEVLDINKEGADPEAIDEGETRIIERAEPEKEPEFTPEIIPPAEKGKGNPQPWQPEARAPMMEDPQPPTLPIEEQNRRASMDDAKADEHPQPEEKPSLVRSIVTFLFGTSQPPELKPVHEEGETTFWARIKSFFAGSDRGTNDLPEINDEENLMEGLESGKDTASDLAQENALRLQEAMNEKEQAEKATSDALKVMNQTQRDLVKNLK